MDVRAVHHVAVAVRDLEGARAFYCGVLGLRESPRPAFASEGTWLGLGETQVHLIQHPGGSYRAEPAVDLDDVHFALRVGDFDAAVAHLERAGFAEDAADP